MVAEQNCTDFNKTFHVKIKNGISSTDVVSELLDAILTQSDFLVFPFTKQNSIAKNKRAKDLRWDHTAKAHHGLP